MRTHHFSENEVQLLRKGDYSRPMDAENSTENSFTDLENAKSGSEDPFQEKCSQGSLLGVINTIKQQNRKTNSMT